MRAPRSLIAPAAFALLLVIGCSSREAAADNFSLKVEAPKDAKVGQVAKAIVLVSPKSGWKVNTKYPIRLKLQPAGGVDVPKAEFRGGDGQITEHEAKFEIAFTVREAGAKTITGELKFSICAADKCDIKKEAVSWTTSAR